MVATPPDSFFRSYAPHPSEERNSPNSPQEPVAAAEASVDAEPMDSSDAPYPSEESMYANESVSMPEPFLSSDAPHGYIGRKQITGDAMNGHAGASVDPAAFVRVPVA
jgi:hypothetical protein